MRPPSRAAVRNDQRRTRGGGHITLAEGRLSASNPVASRSLFTSQSRTRVLLLVHMPFPQSLSVQGRRHLAASQSKDNSKTSTFPSSGVTREFAAVPQFSRSPQRCPVARFGASLFWGEDDCINESLEGLRRCLCAALLVLSSRASPAGVDCRGRGDSKMGIHMSRMSMSAVTDVF